MQINIQEDVIKCVLQIKIEYKITMLPIYNFDFTIKCKDVYYMKHQKEIINNIKCFSKIVSFKQCLKGC